MELSIVRMHSLISLQPGKMMLWGNWALKEATKPLNKLISN